MIFLKKHWQIILIVLMAVIIYFLFQGRARDKDTIQTLVHQSDSAFNQIRYYKDKNDRLRAQVNTHEVTLRNFKDFWAADSKRLKGQIGNLNKLVGFWKGKAGMVDTIYTTLTDTVYLTRDGFNTDKAFNWSNDNLTLSGGLNTASNQLSLDYQYQVNFELVSYYKKSGFMKRQLVADISFSDPNLKVQEFQGIQIKAKERFYQKTWFKIGVGFLAGFTASTL
jgi:hypothetical protein